MTPLEELQAAHERLTTLREGGAPSPWHVGDSDPTPDWEMNRAVGCADEHLTVTDYIDVVDAELIVTLHRTIDAQLALIGAAIGFHHEYASNEEIEAVSPQELRLTRAINGEAS